MGKSYGFIEIQGVVAAVDALDIMCKTADVELTTWERKLGGRLVTIVVQGDVSAVTQAVDAACKNGIKKPVVHGVIANPHPEVVRLLQKSASRWKAKLEAKNEVKEETKDELKTKDELNSEDELKSKVELKSKDKDKDKDKNKGKTNKDKTKDN